MSTASTAALAAPERFAGLAQADSISLDAHKWLYQPPDCSALLYRDAGAARRLCRHRRVRQAAVRRPGRGFAFFEESIELSRRSRVLKLWLPPRYRHRPIPPPRSAPISNTQLLARLITAEPTLELLAPVELSMVCFHWKDATEAELGERNAAILREILRRGRVYVSNASVHGAFALRACIVTHRTIDADIVAVVEEVVAAAATA
jgi:aromatic-L-amino-acid/L-tryptophan decarboxylase